MPADRDELATRWSALHHDIDPSRMPLLTGWLRLMWRGGHVLAAAGVPPTAVTITGVGLAGSAVALAPRHPAAAGAAVLVAALCDGLDGAVAVVAQRATRHGRIADAVADRLSDAAFALVLQRQGAPSRLVGAAVAGAWGVDTLRRVRRVPARVTVAERPTFTICALLACGATAITGRPRPARASAVVWLGASAVGVVQLARTPVADPAYRGRPV